jgi:hypothetical protein
MRRWLVLLLLCLSASPALAEDEVRILVVDLQAKGAVLPGDADILTGIVTTRLGRYPKAAVLSGADIREMIALEAEKQAAGCDDASCLSEVAGALGAELIVTGQVGRLGDRYVVTMNLISVNDARAVGRETVELGSLSAAPGAVRPAVDKLVEPMGERIGKPKDRLSFAEVVDLTLTWTGWSLAGVGAATLAIEHTVFLISYLGLKQSPVDTAFFPVCGPGFAFLNEGVSPDPANSDDITTVAFGCCLCELASCGLCLMAPAALGGGAVVGLFDSEDDDAGAAALLDPPSGDPLSEEDRARLAVQMPY